MWDLRREDMVAVEFNSEMLGEGVAGAGVGDSQFLLMHTNERVEELAANERMHWWGGI